MLQQSSSYQLPVLNENPQLQESNQDRINRIKKSKNIRKEKVQEKRNLIQDVNSNHKTKTTREQRKNIQKEKNRVAAQVSRDKQKLYLETLEIKIVDLEHKLSTKLCSKCKITLTEHSTSEEAESFNNLEEPENKQMSILNYQQSIFEVSDLPLSRDYSKNDADWGNIGKYFCLVLMVLAVAMMSGSVENTQNFKSQQSNRILTQNQICVSSSTKLRGYTRKSMRFQSSQFQVPSTIQQIQRQVLPFKQNIGNEIEQCKNDFWNNYLQGIYKSDPYDWNLVSCTNPNLFHITNDNNQSEESLGGKWTFLITNPTVTHSHVKQDGNNYIDEVNYLQGIYQMVADNVVLKKVMGQKCLV